MHIENEKSVFKQKRKQVKNSENGKPSKKSKVTKKISFDEDETTFKAITCNSESKR